MNLRRIGIVLSVIVLAISLVLLLNFTAPNPTHRRYSSLTPKMGSQFTANAIGLDGEEILAADLHLPRNDVTGQTHCICNTDYAGSPPGRCTTCFVLSEQVMNYRIPDFIGSTFIAPTFIADSKNVISLIQNSEDFQQIQEYTAVARAYRIPLWLFVRVDSRIDPEFTALAERTGGGVVYYFTVPGYVDPVDAVAAVGGGLSVLFLLGVSASAWAAKRQWGWPTRSTSGKPGDRRAKRAAAATENLDWFQERSRSRAKHIIDVEDSRDEPPET